MENRLKRFKTRDHTVGHKKYGNRSVGFLYLFYVHSRHLGVYPKQIRFSAAVDRTPGWHHTTLYDGNSQLEYCFDF